MKDKRRRPSDGAFFLFKGKNLQFLNRKLKKKTKQIQDDSDIEYGNDKTFQKMQGEGPA